MVDREILDLCGHFFYALLALGMVLLARKSRWGWVLRFAGEIGWIAIGLEMGMSSMWTWGALFLVMDVYGYVNWRETND